MKVALGVFLYLSLCGIGSAATFTATLDRSAITLGETATLSLTLSGAQLKDAPSPAPVPNLRIAYLGPSSQITIINGEMRATVTHLFSVTPAQVGEFTIPAITVEAGGQKLSSQPLKLMVNKPGVPPPDAVNSGAQLAFMRLSLPKTNLFLNEMMAAELQLYLNQQVRDVSGFQLTALPADGFATSKLVQGQTRRTQVGNAVYTVVPFTLVLRPTRSGALVLGPVTATVTVEINSARSRRRDPFFDQFGLGDPFDMFSGTASRQATLATEPASVHVEPLPPANVPPSFNGAVGTFTMTASAGPTNVAVGDPITIKVQISGRGAFDSLNLPEQSAWTDFKTYPPTSKVDLADQLGLQGTKTFEQVVAPLNANVKQLPPMAFSYFDPEARAYRTLRNPAVPLVVKPAAAVPAPAISAVSRDTAPPTPDLVHIKQRLGPLAQAGPPLVLKPSFIAVQAIPFLALLVAYALRKRAELLARNPRLRRRKHVAQLVREGLLELHQLASNGNSEQFFSNLFHLLQEQLGERLDMPASAITEAVIDEKLRPLGAPEKLTQGLHDLFQACNVARYAPATSPGQLESLLPNVATVLRETSELNL